MTKKELIEKIEFLSGTIDRTLELERENLQKQQDKQRSQGFIHALEWVNGELEEILGKKPQEKEQTHE